MRFCHLRRSGAYVVSLSQRPWQRFFWVWNADMRFAAVPCSLRRRTLWRIVNIASIDMLAGRQLVAARSEYEMSAAPLKCNRSSEK